MRLFLNQLAAVTLLLLLPTGTVRAVLLESWENIGLAGYNNQEGPWTRAAQAPANLELSFSELHATQGKYSLAIKTWGGWTQTVLNGDNYTYTLGDEISLRDAFEDKLMLAIDVYCDRSVEWAQMHIALQGEGLEWTQLAGYDLRPGRSRTIRYLIPDAAAEKIKASDGWFNVIFIINSNKPGCIYLDRFRAE